MTGQDPIFDFLPINWDVINILVSIVIAAVGILIAYAVRKADVAETNREKDRHAALIAHEKERNRFELILSFRAEVSPYVREVCMEIGASMTLLEEREVQTSDSEAASQREKFISNANNLSALLDFGRTLFPNYDHDYGNEKGPAYSGTRQEVLDAILVSYQVIMYVAKDDNPVPSHQKISHSETQENAYLRVAYRRLSARSRKEIKEQGWTTVHILLMKSRRDFLNSVWEYVRPKEYAVIYKKVWDGKISEDIPK